MTLRSLKLTNFRGVPELALRDLRPKRVQHVELPSSADASVLADAVRYVLLGTPPADGAVISPGAGFAFVEIGLRLPDDSEVSVFRGVDGRGKTQISLREAGGSLATGGADDVAARLAVLLGGDIDDWVRAACLETSDVSADAFSRHLARPDDTGLMTEPVELTPLPTEEVSAAVPAAAAALSAAEAKALEKPALDAAEELRRSLRAERLRRYAAQTHGTLLEAGERLRRTRADVAVEVDELTADRERARTRVQGVEEYQGLVRAEEEDLRRQRERVADESVTVVAAAESPGGAFEPLVGTCASILFLVLSIVSFSPDPELQRHGLRVGLGLGFLGASAAYLGLLTKRLGPDGRFLIGTGPAISAGFDPPVAVAPPPPDPGPTKDVWRAALEHRFRDLEDPDDPELPKRLGKRQAELEERLLPVHRRLEAVDDALVAFDVEAGRAARALHMPMPERRNADTGLAAGESPEGVLEQVKAWGDAVYQANVEREALRAGGAATVPDSAAALASALEPLATAAGEPSAAVRPRLEALRGMTGDDDASFGEVSATPWEDAEVDALCDEIARLAKAATVGGVTASETLTKPAPSATRASSATERPAATQRTIETSDLVAAASGGTHEAAYVASDGGVRLRASGKGGSRPWDEVDAGLRSVVAAAVALRARIARGGKRTANPLRFVVLPVPVGGVEDRALVAALNKASPGILQVVVPVPKEGEESRPDETPPAEPAGDETRPAGTEPKGKGEQPAKKPKKRDARKKGRKGKGGKK